MRILWDMGVPSIYEFKEFRRFLAAWLAARKEEDPRFNGGEVHRRLGLPNTRSFFPDVVAGRRVTPSFVERFVVLLELDRSEAQFFRSLVRLDQAASAEERELAFDHVVSLDRSPRTMLDGRLMSFYRDWRHGAIRALLDTGDYDNDAARICREIVPRLTPGQVRESLELLADLALIAKNEHGFWKPTEASIAAPEGTRDELFLQLQLQHLELAQKSLLSKEAPERLVATNVVSTSRETAIQIERKLEKLRAEIRALVARDPSPASEVLLFQLSLIPLKKPSQETTP
jgi:uncharacterized protein (TIGR02147 family)